jgi:hypothetical protein
MSTILSSPSKSFGGTATGGGAFQGRVRVLVSPVGRNVTGSGDSAPGKSDKAHHNRHQLKATQNEATSSHLFSSPISVLLPLIKHGWCDQAIAKAPQP